MVVAWTTANNSLDTIDSIVEPWIIPESNFHLYEGKDEFDRDKFPVGKIPIFGGCTVVHGKVTAINLAYTGSTVDSLAPVAPPRSSYFFPLFDVVPISLGRRLHSSGFDETLLADGICNAAGQLFFVTSWQENEPRMGYRIIQDIAEIPQALRMPTEDDNIILLGSGSGVIDGRGEVNIIEASPPGPLTKIVICNPVHVCWLNRTSSRRVVSVLFAIAAGPSEVPALYLLSQGQLLPLPRCTPSLLSAINLCSPVQVFWPSERLK